MATYNVEKTVVWESQNQKGIWCSYSGEVGQLLELSLKKKLNTVRLRDADIGLKAYTVDLAKMSQISEVTGAVSKVRRKCISQDSAVARGIVWQWRGDGHGCWQNYDADVINCIEEAYKEGRSTVDLSETFPHCKYEIHLGKMQQRNKRTKHGRSVRRITVAPYPVTKCTLEGVDEDNVTYEALTKALDDVDCSVGSSDVSLTISPGKNHLIKHVSGFWSKLKKSAEDMGDNLVAKDNKKHKKQCVKNEPKTGPSKHNANYLLCDTEMEVSTTSNSETNKGKDTTNSSEPAVAVVNGKSWYNHWPPHIPHSKLKPVPGVPPLSSPKKKKSEKTKEPTKAVENNPESVLNTYTEKICVLPNGDDEDKECVICFEELSAGSSYDNDNTIVKLKLCRHIFHRSCLKAMHESGPKDACLQCPTCKTIHGEKHGIQPPGTMVYHVIPCSLPGYPDCKTIRIVYDIHGGIQGPEHPHPGQRYTACGFPRTCYLPNNEQGRRVLKLLVKAWERKLVFTIGTSSTTGIANTVTWNEIHHKTEFGFSQYGHGFPDPNYFENVIAELAAHGVTD